MSLPGKLCIGILEEDNPQKSYFRFKPLLVEEGGRYTPYAEPDVYPEEGCIRIVPDKNESYHFKARMRRIGLYCVVDLRAHPDENDKIRPNKNYREGSPEQNAFIIYSDVVREPAPDMIFDILPEGADDEPLPQPHTSGVLLRGEALLPRRYAWESVPDAEGTVRLLPTEQTLATEHMQQFDLNGFRDERVAFAIVLPDHVERVSDAPAPKPPRPAAEEARSAAQREQPRQQDALPDQGGPAAASPKPPAQAQEPPAEEEKPWIHRDTSMLPRPVDARLSPAQRNLAVQSGINPRRGRSLLELIDEKWQLSRLNQLGQPVSPIQTGAPLASPVDSAVRAVREVWSQPQLRDDLLKSLGGIEEFGASLEECREAARRLDIEQHLEGLEARRLALMGEIDHLSLKSAEVRSALKQELRRDEDASLAEAVQRTKAARDEQEKYEKLARDARAAAQDARKAVEALTGEALEQQLTQFALNGHMLERLRELKGQAEVIPPAPPTLQSIDLNALAVRVMNRFDASGFPITRAEAMNLCVCAAVSPVLILSGPVGSGKTETARMLGEALGWVPVDRFAAFDPGRGSLVDDPRLAALDRLPQVPALLLLDDANLYPNADPMRGLYSRLRPQWRLCLTVQDGGYPLSAHALDRGFMLRLSPKPAAPWRPRPGIACESEAPASLSPAIPDNPLPSAVESRMDDLRGALSRRGAQLSRRALDDAWRYCSLMLAALGDSADPMALLDLAVAQRLLPGLLACAPLEALSALPGLLEGLPRSRALLSQPLPIQL